MKVVATLAVYGNFKEKDIRIKVFTDSETSKFVFQNTLREAGYDCELFSLNDTDLERKSE